MVSQADAVRRTVGLAGQYAAVDENLTGRENIFMVGRLSHLSRKVSSRRADELLEDFGLSGPGVAEDAYSGGQPRRAEPGRRWWPTAGPLLTSRPPAGPTTRQALWATIEDLVRDGTTVLLTTQYLEEADRLARDIVVIDHGRVIAEGVPAQLKADLGTSVVSVTLGDRRGSGGRAAHAVLGEAAAGRGSRDRAHGHRRPQGGSRRAARARRRRESPSPVWPCASPAWTTCS